MSIEEQRYLHEDLERLEQAVAERLGYNPTNIRDRLNIETEIAQLLDQIKEQSQKLLDIYEDKDGSRARDVADTGLGETDFYEQLNRLKEHHSKYPNQQAENAELRYRSDQPGDEPAPYIVDSLFSGEEAFGRFFDLNRNYEAFSNFAAVKRLTYMQYLDIFDNFQPGAGGLKRTEKLTDPYFRYLGQLSEYLESFFRRTRPLEDVDKLMAEWDREFDTAWDKNEVEGWQESTAATVAAAGDGTFCEACEKCFKNEAVFNAHLSGKKHAKAVAQKAEYGGDDTTASGAGGPAALLRLKERAVAEREFRIRKLAGAMNTQRSDTRMRVERRLGMTERERLLELEEVLSLSTGGKHRLDAEGDRDDDGGDDRIHNPLKLPLAWDGKPIPFWLYRLHGLGVEHPCEICGNFVYMGRRAFDKHFNEARHIYGLKCLGIQNTSLFRDITRIDEARNLCEKIQTGKKKSRVDDSSVVQMEDPQGNVMPEKVYLDLQKQGLL